MSNKIEKTSLLESGQKWSKAFVKVWIIGFIALLLFLVYPVNKDSSYSRADISIHLLLPYKLQRLLYNLYDRDDACHFETEFLGFNRTVIGKMKSTSPINLSLYGDTSKECKTDKRDETYALLGILIFGVVLFGSIIPWILSSIHRKYGLYKSGKRAVDLISEHNYLQAYREVESDNIQSPELWAKAFALSEGDVDKQGSIYVELRARQLDSR